MLRPTTRRFRPTLARAGRRLALTAAAATALAPAAPAALAAQRASYTSLTFFGDSYIDTGNLYLLTSRTQPPSPPYATGRFSNGPVWSEYFAAALGRPADAAPVLAPGLATGTFAASGNYAVAGARTDGTSPPGTATQIGAYLTRPGAAPGAVTDPTGLYVLFVGGNDLRDAGGLATAAERQAAAAAAAGRLVTQAQTLAGAGAKTVLLFTLPSLGATPEVQGIPGRPAIQDALAATFNSTLAAGLAGLQGALPGSTFLNFRLDNLYANLLADAAAGGGTYGLTNTTAPCLGAGAPSCDVSVFADALHPTTRTAQVIGLSAARYATTGVNVAAVPEPATLALVAGGVAALGAAARRRRAA